MARTWQALATLIAVCSSLTNAALYGRNETTVAGSGTIISSSSTSIALSPTSAANTNTTLSSTSTTNSTTTVNVPSSTGLTTFLASSTLWSSSTLLTSFSTSTTGINATVPFPTDTGSAISLTTSLISTDLTSSMPSTSATSTTRVTGSNSTSETTLTSLSSNSSTNITLIPATLSSGSIVETSTITSKISGSGFGTTTTSLSQTSTTTGIPVVTNGQCKGSDCTDGNPDSPTSSQTPSSSSSCRTQTASLCVAACSVTAIAVNSTTTLTTSCYTTACSATIACSVEATTTSSFTTSMSTSNGACMTVIPFSGIASSGSVVSTSYTATEITYTISTVTAKSASSTGMGTSSDSAVTLSTTMTNSTLSTSTDSSSSDNPLAKRADVVGDALSCPYSPPAQDTYCTYFGLSKRANAAKEINLPWASALKWSNYPQCPNTGTKGITQVPKFYHPAGASTAQNGIQNYDPTSSQSASTNGRIAGIAQSDFANDHVFEAQLISGFLSWLCGQPSVTGYTQIPWPAGWTQPDTTWCAAVFGSDADAQSGFLFPAFPGDNTGDNNFLGNCAEVTGGVSQPTLMAVYYGPANGWKGKITKAQWPAFSSLSGTVAQQQEQAGVVIRDTANVFQYLRDATIQDAWTTPSKSVETVCVQFDNNFWGSTSAANAPGTALDGPASPQGVVNWGMRTMWAYWIDNHLYKIEQQVPSWVILALGKVGGAGGGFARSYMQANGMVSASQMHFPLDANSPNAPIPGTQGSATSTVSRYMMWDGATHGALGL
ncbi:hypothetical protein D6D24_01880 [Aureobasidium pullulans]|uniref:Concanavalin A-like lectin/glucanase n=1 Tax=Aureobasidium pullulans TaxID=5580 RepID=A0A4S8W772_AURPU|nr:hypothetical protein D6D24_01880 [Aureobasidium pullulans]